MFDCIESEACSAGGLQQFSANIENMEAQQYLKDPRPPGVEVFLNGWMSVINLVAHVTKTFKVCFQTTHVDPKEEIIVSELRVDIA